MKFNIEILFINNYLTKLLNTSYLIYPDKSIINTDAGVPLNPKLCANLKFSLITAFSV